MNRDIVMKAIYCMYCLLFAITIISPVATAQGAEWFSIGEDRAGNELFFDLRCHHLTD